MPAQFPFSRALRLDSPWFANAADMSLAIYRGMLAMGMFDSRLTLLLGKSGSQIKEGADWAMTYREREEPGKSRK